MTHLLDLVRIRETQDATAVVHQGDHKLEQSPDERVVVEVDALDRCDVARHRVEAERDESITVRIVEEQSHAPVAEELGRLPVPSWLRLLALILEHGEVLRVG